MDAEALSDALLEPFRADIAAARVIRVLAYGALRGVDVHALPWDGEPLLAARPVVYGLDVASRPPAREPTGGAWAFVDPTRDLPRAREDGDALRARSAHAHVVSREAATRAALGPALTRAGWLHFAGHAEVKGRGGWQSGLVLSDGLMSVGDILRAPRVPPTVVLSACRAAEEPEGSRLPTIGLAQAFVLAGAERVVAATRPVSDETAAALARALYRRAGPGAAAELAESLRAALLEMRAANPGSDWATYRLLAP